MRRFLARHLERDGHPYRFPRVTPKAYYDRRHKATQRGAGAQLPYLPQDIYERDGWVCQLCGLPVDREVDPSRGADAPTIDHVIPVSLGGGDVPENVQLAHRSCNARKGTKVTVADTAA